MFSMIMGYHGPIDIQANTVDGSEIRGSTHQLRLVVDPHYLQWLYTCWVSEPSTVPPDTEGC